jgi:hypothetical protein
MEGHRESVTESFEIRATVDWSSAKGFIPFVASRSLLSRGITSQRHVVLLARSQPGSGTELAYGHRKKGDAW